MRTILLLLLLGLRLLGYSQSKDLNLLGIWRVCDDSLYNESLKNNPLPYIKILSSDSTFMNLYWNDISCSVIVESGTYDIISSDRYIELTDQTINKSAPNEKEIWFEFRSDNLLMTSYLLPNKTSKRYVYWTRMTSVAANYGISKDTVYSKVSQMPEFPNGVSALLEFIAKNLRYPYKPFDETMSVVVEFVVERDGSLTNLRIRRSADFLYYDKEAIRVVKSMPKWKPGYKDGKPVRVYYSVPVLFRIQ